MTETDMRRINPCERVLTADDKELRITAVMSTERNVGDGYVLEAKGAKIRSGGDSIPLLWVHGFDSRGWIPIGSVRNIRVETVRFDGADVPALVGDKFYYQPSEAVKSLTSDLVNMPRVLYDMRKQGHMRAVSVGFRPVHWDSVKPEGSEESYLRVTEWTLNELSDCPVGMDEAALDRYARSAGLNQLQREWITGRECQHCGRCDKPDPQQASIQASRILGNVGLAIDKALTQRRV